MGQADKFSKKYKTKQNGGMSIPYRLHETRQKNIILNLPLLLNFIEHNTAVDAGQQQQQLQILLKLSTKLWVNK